MPKADNRAVWKRTSKSSYEVFDLKQHTSDDGSASVLKHGHEKYLTEAAICLVRYFPAEVYVRDGAENRL